MMQLTHSDFYPVFAFPPIARAAIQELLVETQAPAAMCGNSVLAAMALAVQGQYRVRRREGLESPCSIATVSIAASGERKTTVDRKTTKAFHDFQAERLNEHEERYAEYRAKKLIWDTRRRLLIRQFEKAVESAEPLDAIQLAIVEHEQAEPQPPRRIRFIYSDVTPAALLYGLHENTRSACLNEDEAARFFDGPMSDDACLITKGWDGSDLMVDRRSSESFSIKAPRVTLNLMVQPTAFAKYMERKGEEARGVGLIARWLVCCPMTTQGTRFIHQATPEPIAQTTFNNRIKEILEQQAASGALESSSAEIVLSFAPDAEREWILVANQVEEAIRPGGAFCEASDYASKVAENIARIAGVFHAFAGYEGTQISLETLRSAVTVARWYAQEFIRLFSPPDPLNSLIRDAVVLENWLVKIVQTRGWFQIERNFILQCGPNSLRNRDRLNWALGYLNQTQRLWIQPAGNRKQIVCLNDNYFGQIARGIQPIGFAPL